LMPGTPSLLITIFLKVLRSGVYGGWFGVLKVVIPMRLKVSGRFFLRLTPTGTILGPMVDLTVAGAVILDN